MRPLLAFPAAALAAWLVLGGGFSPPALSAETSAGVAKPAADTSVPVDVNRATVDELIAVPGIGESLAQRIVDFRAKNGPFQRVDDLLKVRGIGEKSLEKLRPHLRVASGK